MGDRATKDALFAEFAVVGKVLGSPKRLELIDLLAQGPRSVEDLASVAELGMSTCSAHLQTLRESGVVMARREGKRVYYSLAGDEIAGLVDQLHKVAQRYRPQTDLARRAHLGWADTDAVDTNELLRRLKTGDIVVLDVRPASEYAAGHLPGAIHMPVERLSDRLAELPCDHEIVAYCRGKYCMLAHEAVRLLTAHGLTARRAVDGVLEWRVGGHAFELGAA